MICVTVGMKDRELPLLVVDSRYVVCTVYIHTNTEDDTPVC